MAKSISGLPKSLTPVIFMCTVIMSFPYLGHGKMISCATVQMDLSPCISYVLIGGTIDPACCTGAKTLVSLAKTTADRRTVCSCLKSYISNVTDDQVKNAANIPNLCNVQVPFNISRDVDCSKVNLS